MILFNVCINYLYILKKIPALECEMCTDDVFWSSTKNKKDYHEVVESRISKGLSELDLWTEENNMLIHTSKIVYSI